MKTIRRIWIRVIEFVQDPFCDVEFDEKDMPIVTHYIRT